MTQLWDRFDRIIVFDTETTGIVFGKDQIIELGAVSLEKGQVLASMDVLIRLPQGQHLPPFITELTGITEEQLDSEGVEPEQAAKAFCSLFQGAKNPLLVAYNAQFDLNFLYYLLRPYNQLGVLKQSRFLDALTVYRDRRDYPHKLSDAIPAYCLQDFAVNSHRAVDDAHATVLLLEAMAEECDDLLEYIDLFGIHPKYGISGRAISSVTYREQPYNRMLPLYQRT